MIKFYEEKEEKEEKDADMELPFADLRTARGLSKESLALAIWLPNGMIKLDEIILKGEEGFQGIVNVALVAPVL